MFFKFFFVYILKNFVFFFVIELVYSRFLNLKVDYFLLLSFKIILMMFCLILQMKERINVLICLIYLYYLRKIMKYVFFFDKEVEVNINIKCWDEKE